MEKFLTSERHIAVILRASNLTTRSTKFSNAVEVFVSPKLISNPPHRRNPAVGVADPTHWASSFPMGPHHG